MAKIEPHANNMIRYLELKKLCERVILTAFDLDDEATFPDDIDLVIYTEFVETNFSKELGEGTITIKFRTGIAREEEIIVRRRRLTVPPCTEDRSDETLIYPPLPGVLPGYTLDLETEAEIESFRRWLETLSGPDRVKVELKMQWRRFDA